jgi:hypothetical protein
MLGIHCRAIGGKTGRWHACRSPSRSKSSREMCESSAKSAAGHRKNSPPGATCIERTSVPSNDPRRILRLERWTNWPRRCRFDRLNFWSKPGIHEAALCRGVDCGRKKQASSSTKRKSASAAWTSRVHRVVSCLPNRPIDIHRSGRKVTAARPQH